MQNVLNSQNNKQRFIATHNVFVDMVPEVHHGYLYRQHHNCYKQVIIDMSKQ